MGESSASSSPLLVGDQSRKSRIINTMRRTAIAIVLVVYIMCNQVLNSVQVLTDSVSTSASSLETSEYVIASMKSDSRTLREGVERGLRVTIKRMEKEKIALSEEVEKLRNEKDVIRKELEAAKAGSTVEPSVVKASPKKVAKKAAKKTSPAPVPDSVAATPLPAPIVKTSPAKEAMENTSPAQMLKPVVASSVATTTATKAKTMQLFGETESKRLLDDAGLPSNYMAPVDAAVMMPRVIVKKGTAGTNTNETNPQPEERCAINLFGLPRAFQSLVLPALIQNVIRPNAEHNCDYFVHYFNLTKEDPGRSGKGGHLNTLEILLLEQHVQRETPPGRRRPKVGFLAEQEEDFWKNYESLIQKTHDTRDSKGRYLYYPWKEASYKYPATVDNIIKMWHSIQSAWLLMERHATGHNVQYTRVAMLRSDVIYATPIDIYRLDNYRLGTDSKNDTSARTRALFDLENTYAVVPNFAKYPVNDRMIYGPHAAVKIWATERFARLETHVQSILKDDPGYGMHSERFLNHTIFPAIQQAGFEIYENPHLCFFRARADESVWVSDCKTRAERTVEKKKELVERLIGRNCGRITVFPQLRTVQILDCKSAKPVEKK